MRPFGLARLSSRHVVRRWRSTHATLPPAQPGTTAPAPLPVHPVGNKVFAPMDAGTPRRPMAGAIEQAADLLPNQGILENFVHHNPLEYFQSMDFRAALEHVHRLESYMAPGERAYLLTNIDVRKRVNEGLVDLCAAFLDRGAAKWTPQFRDEGFLSFFAKLESLGPALWRRHARDVAQRVLAQAGRDPRALAEEIVAENLEWFGVPAEDSVDAIRAMMLELRGWAGMFWRMETHPAEMPAQTAVRLVEFCAVQSILVRASIETLALGPVGWDVTRAPVSAWLNTMPPRRKGKHAAARHSSAIAHVNQESDRREALETEFKHTLLRAIGNEVVGPKPDLPRPTLQVYTCIDDRECSFRRHIEAADPSAIETFGLAGFFGIPICYKPADGRDQMILAPEGQKPTAVLVENTATKGVALYNQRRRRLADLALQWENMSFSPLGSLALSSLLPLPLVRLQLMGFAPALKQRLRDRLLDTLHPRPLTDFALPVPAPQAAAMLARSFKDIGTHKRFAPIVLVFGHGAMSNNNPFFAAYNCGACGGREGGPNARLMARLANNSQVRMHLRNDHDIHVPDDTVFVGAMHNTTAELIEFYDTDAIPASHRAQFAAAQAVIERARGLNALERCSRFLLASSVDTPEEALQHVYSRATDAAEVRPELNHATNAAVVVGRRELTTNRFLDRRAFLPSYDPFSDDAKGTNLEHVLAPALVVCSGINLEYLFSTIDAEHHGAGSKAPLNIVGNIGVLQGTTGDLRPGLPTQMTEMHTPLRALFVVDAPVERVEAVLARRDDLRQLVRNEWVRFIVRDPATGQFLMQSRGEYTPIEASGTSTEQHVSFAPHRQHGLAVARREAVAFWAATSAIVASCGASIYLYGAAAMNPYGSLIALSGTLLALPTLAFARRYLHGEFMFGRFAALSAALVLGFDLVATATCVEHAMAGWSLFGFSSAFLIGAYNDRATVRNNATFAFTVYRISDFALLVAATFSAHHHIGWAAGPAPTLDVIATLGPHHNAATELAGLAVLDTSGLVAASLLLAALFKSSQFPLTALFARSMEGPTPASALGYAGLSAHLGVVLLTSTMPLWYCFDLARVTLASVGLFTAVYGTLVAKIRADRKGAIACATSATLGLIFTMVAMGYAGEALLLSLGHAAFRMIQILRSPGTIGDTQRLRSALGGYTPWPKIVPDWLYKLSWRLRRFETDVHFMDWIQRAGRWLTLPKHWTLTKAQQWSATALCVVLAGAPFTPLSDAFEEWLMEVLPHHPVMAGAAMAGHLVVSVLLVRFLFSSVLSANRFHHSRRSKAHTPPPPPSTTMTPTAGKSAPHKPTH